MDTLAQIRAVAEKALNGSYAEAPAAFYEIIRLTETLGSGGRNQGAPHDSGLLDHAGTNQEK